MATQQSTFSTQKPAVVSCIISGAGKGGRRTRFGVGLSATAKPRAKAKPKAPPAVLSVRTNSVLERIKGAQTKLAMALHAAELGSAAEVSLNQLCLSWLPAALVPLFRTPLTKGDAEATYEALFPSLAIIEAVIALAAGTVIEHVLREGHALLYAAHTELDACGALTKLLPDGPSEAAAAVTSFNRGRDLAIAMIDAADDVQFRDPNSASPYRAYRNGSAQNRITESFVLQLLADPSMLDGFNAVLSAKLVDECGEHADFYRFSPAEYSEGAVGADGTLADPDNQGTA
jgi:hypothetical protein